MKLLLPLFLILFAQQPADPDLDRALVELKAGNTVKAIAAIGDSIKKNPDHADAYVLRGSIRMSANDTAGALADFNKAIQLKPTKGEAYNERAIIRLMAQDISGANKDLDAAITNGFINDGIYLLRAQLRQQQGDLKGAIADLDEAIKLNPNNPQTYGYRAGLLSDSKEMDRALIDLNYLLTWYETEPNTRRDNKPINPVKTANEGEVKNNTPFTIGIDAKTVNGTPADKEMLPIIAASYVRRGLIHSARDNSDAAIADFTKSIRVEPKNPWAYYDRANELEGKGDLEAALADVNRAIQLEPLNGNLRVEHGVILTLMGNTKEAQVDFDMLLRTDTNVWQKRIDERLEAVKKKLPTPEE